MKKPVMPKAAPPKTKFVAPAMPTAPMRYDDPDGKKPNPNGLYNRDGFMDRVPGKANKFTPPAAAPSAPYTSAADQQRLASQKQLVAQGNADRARIAAAKAKKK